MMTEDEAKERLREAARDAGSKAELARRIGVTKAMITGVLNGHFLLSDRVARGIGMRRVVMYKEIDDE